MDTEATAVDETTVSQEDVNLDEIFNLGPNAESVMLPEDTKPKFFERDPKIDLDAITEEPTDVAKKTETEEGAEVKEVVEETTEETTTEETTTKESDEAFAAIDEAEGVTEPTSKAKATGIAGVFDKLIKEDKIVPFDDDKALNDYTSKDWEELINANLEEKANEVRRETPQQFFESLPQELQIAAKYVADGGQDLKGLFSALATVEETRDLDIKSERDQEKVITEYLTATGYGTVEEINEEIEVWKDLGKLEAQASKFKPKLDKMQESVVARRLEEQQMKEQQQQQASQQYMENVYNTLKEGSLGNIKMDKKVQAMLYNGLVQPNYPSISGKNTNLLGHLLEKYQFVEPNYELISEALWLLQDPESYKAKIMEKGANKSVEATVRKLKTEQSSRAGSSLGVESEEESRPTKRKLPRSNNMFQKF
tara:strand:- start:16048 stop:17322 length:1275 start_codon:yes stop_codon:yes gene_type:complete